LAVEGHVLHKGRRGDPMGATYLSVVISLRVSEAISLAMVRSGLR
jgi:hypothetical protein